MNITRSAVLAALSCLASGQVLPAAAPAASGSAVTIRVYDRFGVPDEVMERTRSTLHTIMEGAGIDADWRECRTGKSRITTARDACEEPLGPFDLMIRIVKTPLTMRDPHVLGFSYVDVGRRWSVLGTVLADRTFAEARRLGLPEGTLLGRAVAHEVGHLTLDTTDHAPDGVMRPSWPGRREAHRLEEEWQFSESEAAAMRRVLAERFTSTPDMVARSLPAPRHDGKN